ncbi:cupin domain-containing protein [Streptacidiphilus sp. MAP5-3]|uniref:cupin domain-containing protein n=1 Tax=unclassified Streptacidiphilus TaxID=2643834 RepID=UPI0035111CF4
MSELEYIPQPRRVEVMTDLLGEGLVNGQVEWRPYVQPGREAVDVRWLYTGDDTGPDGAEAYIAHFRPGAHGDLHRHLGFELLFILDGELVNDNGDRYQPGTLVVEHPDSIHRVSSPKGCKMLVIREKRTLPLRQGELPDTALALDGAPLSTPAA